MSENKKHTLWSGHRILVAGVLCLFGFCLTVHSQQNNRQPKQKSKVYLIHSNVLRKDAQSPDAQIVVGDVIFRHDSVYMYCDSARYYDKVSAFEAFDNVRVEQGDTLFLYGDRLFYDGMTQIAEMRMNVRMENQTTTLLTDSLNYDRLFNLGYFFDGGTMMDDQNVLSSEWGQYSPGTKEAVFNYNVKVEGPKYTLTSDTLCYNTATKVVNIVGPSDIFNESNHIYSESGYYYTQEGHAELFQRSVLTNDGKQLVGDTLFFNRNTGVGEVFSNIVFNDSVSRNMMTGDYGYYNEKTKKAFATKKALAIDYSQGDSLFLHADTLMMETFNADTDSMYREVKAFRKVRFYRRDMQGVADSLVFTSVDSCLTMYHDPVIWSNNQQLLGEQIKVYMNDSTIDWAHIINQALSVEQVSVDSMLFNQVSGKEMKAFFRNKEMYKTQVDGSVRSVYYPMDSDSLLMGMNVAESSTLEVYLEHQKLERMIMKPKSTAEFYPMAQIPRAKSKLQAFQWLNYLRPVDKDDVFNWRGKKAGDQLKKNVRGPVKLPNQDLFSAMEKEMAEANKNKVATDSLNVQSADTAGVKQKADAKKLAGKQSADAKQSVDGKKPADAKKTVEKANLKKDQLVGPKKTLQR